MAAEIKEENLSLALRFIVEKFGKDALLNQDKVKAILPDLLSNKFTTDSEVVKYGSQFIMFIVPLYFIYAMNQILSGVLRGAGKTFVPMLIGLVCMCGFRVGWLVVMMGIVKDVRIIYASYPLTWILTNIAMTAYYYKSSWIKKTTLEAVETV